MAVKILLLLGGVATASVFASGAQPPQPPRIHADVLIIGRVPCKNDSSVKTASSPAFSNALVHLQCTDGAVMANATTDGRGWFRLAMNTTTAPSAIAAGCKLVVDTPLPLCNPEYSETSGVLVSALRLLVSMVLIPRGFSYVASLV